MMKKTMIMIMGFMIIMSFVGSAYAGTWTQVATAGGGGLVTAPAAIAGYPDLTFDPSPGVLMSGINTVTAYGIVAVNAKAAGDAVAYNVVSGDSALYQSKVTILDTATTTGITPVAGTSITDYIPK